MKSKEASTKLRLAAHEQKNPVRSNTALSGRGREEMLVAHNDWSGGFTRIGCEPLGRKREKG